jgi:glycosyltransferase involved in cell wall biosynthesis
VTPKILFELFNLTVPGGTGIATYARHLCSTAHDLGYEAEGLLHSYRPIETKDSVLAEVGFFDARNRKPSAFDRYVTLNWRRAIGAPAGIRGVALPGKSIVVGSEALSNLKALRRLFVAPMFMDITRFHFKRHGRAATLQVDSAPDIFHATQPIPLRVAGARNIYTIHDIVPLRLPYTTLDDKKFFLNMVRHLGQTSDRIVTVSESSRNDLINICGIAPEKVVNTYQSVSFPEELIAQSDVETARLVEQSFGLKSGDYYLFYGALEPKKNVGRLIDAYIASGSQRSLILAGGLGWEYEGDLEKIEENRSNALRIDGRRILPDERIRRLQHLPLFQLVALIRNARAVVFPSLYEGFGLPVIESMLLRTPVATSNTSSLGEIAGEAALLVDPGDIRSIMAAIQKLDQDDALCAELARRGLAQAAKFSPKAHKERLRRVYDEALAAPAKP